MQIRDSICFGNDIGIASCGWSVLNTDSHSVCGAGVRLFDAPETDKEKTPKNQIRQEKRSLRRLIRRKRQRMTKIRHLCRAHGLTDTSQKDVFQTCLVSLNENAAGGTQVTPWNLRVAALDRVLAGPEFAVILGHIAKHAGFQSNRKGGEKNLAGDDQKALKAMEGLATQIADYRSFGEALEKDPELSARKRNRSGIYDRTPKRTWLRQEIVRIFETQRRHDNPLATPELESAYTEIAFSRLPLQDVEHLVRHCPFEPREKRASKYAPSFERFRFLQSLVHLRIDDPQRDSDRLTPEEIDALERAFGKTQKFSFKNARKILRLSDAGKFRGLPIKDEARDIAARKKPGAQGTHTLRHVLGVLYDDLPPAQLDDAMAKISFRETNASIESGLAETGLPNDAIAALMSAVAENDFHFATGAGHVSAKACRNIIPGLRNGLVYSDACAATRYDHTASETSPFVALRKTLGHASLTEKRKAVIQILSDKERSPINSPIARKAVIETVKQFSTLCHEHPALAGALPGQVNIELAREIGKSGEHRRELTRGLERRNRETDALAKAFEETFGHTPNKGDLRKFELAQEQGWKCLYSGDPIDPARLFDGVSYQVDHILPWSRFGDNSYRNLTLCTAAANQAKQDRTPHEWITAHGLDWDIYVARVEARPGPRDPHGMKGLKKRNYLLKDASEKEQGFRNRNLNDTQWAARVVMQAIEAFYPIELNKNGNPIHRVRARPGAVTALLRRGWGLEPLKKDAEGNRVDDDRHHAIDAMVVAATSESMLRRLTRAVQRSEMLGKPRFFEHMDPPWPDFREQAKVARDGIRCSRAERRRAKGEAHEATLRGLDPDNGCLFTRETAEKLVGGLVTKCDGDSARMAEALAARMARPERSKVIIAALVDWALRGAPQDAPPLGPTGDPIRKIQVIDTRSKLAVPIGAKASADRGEMVRVDVFAKKDRKGRDKFYLVPIYPHQVMDKQRYPLPPNRAIVAGKDEQDWEQITADHTFRFSLYPLCWIEVVTAKGEVIEGYYRGTDRSTGALLISPHQSLQTTRSGIGARSLLSFKKFAVDRLGNISEIDQEERTWHGVACTSATRPG